VRDFAVAHSLLGKTAHIHLGCRPPGEGQETNMHVVVTGSAGKVGREAVAALLRAKHTVTGFDKKAEFAHSHTTVAVDADFFGHQRMIVAAADDALDTLSADLMAKYYPGVPINRPLQGFEPLLSSQLALIGYTPAHSWRGSR
jgi:Mrp family chromosome partitioning ATPase